MHTQNKKLICKRDLLAIITLLIVGVICFVLINHFSQGSSKAVISVNGNVVSEHSLDNISEFTIAEAEGAVIEIHNGKIRVKSSDCSDKICVNTGYISKEGEKIVCLPKKLIIEAKAD